MMVGGMYIYFSGFVLGFYAEDGIFLQKFTCASLGESLAAINQSLIAGY